MNRLIATLLFVGFGVTTGYAQSDSVIITGKLLNLDGRLYREAPHITFSRNNILAPSNELSVNAPLQPDGSFRASLPLAAPVEEMYLDYGGKVFTTFLAKAGEVQITFDADSMFKAAQLFHFKGVNAEANNYYPAYLEQENKLFQANRQLGSDFQRIFWSQSLQAAKQSLTQRGNLRQRALTALLSEGKQASELTEWVNSLVEDEAAMLLMEYSLSNFNELSTADEMEVTRFVPSPLTYQKVLRANRFREYAARASAVRTPASRRNSSSLPVEKIAELALRYVSPITNLEKDKLNLIVEKKNVDKEELDFLSGVYKRGGAKLTTIANFERSVAALRTSYEGPALEFLIAATFVDDFFRYSIEEKKALYQHLVSGMHNVTVRTSLDELYTLEVRDSMAIKQVLTTSLGKLPTEVVSGIWMAESNESGRTWLEEVTKLYQGRPIYVINWDIYDELNREELESVNFLRNYVPEDVVFLFLHVSDPERAQLSDNDPNSEERKRWKQYVVRHKLAGTHLFLTAEQVMQMGLRTPAIPGTYYIIRRDGRYHSRNAPSPQQIEQAAEAINAGSKR